MDKQFRDANDWAKDPSIEILVDIMAAHTDRVDGKSNAKQFQDRITALGVK